MKIPFDIKFKPQIESGEYKVVTRADEPVRIICWDKKEYEGQRESWTPIVYLLLSKGGCEHIMCCTLSGLYSDGLERDSDLFIVIPEPELSEFEDRVKQLMGCYPNATSENKGSLIYEVRKAASKLLAIAEKEITKGHEHDVYIPEDTYHEQLKKQWEEGYDKGKAEALKDLPGWKPATRAYDGDRLLPRIDWSLNRLVARFEGGGIFYLDIRELYKLPGFKEDGHE